MIEARTPDGATHQFPDGTPDDVVDRVVKGYIASNKQPEPPPTITQAVGRGLGLGVRDVVEGAAALPGMALDAVTWPGRAAVRALGGQATAPSDMVTKGLDAAGLPQPETPGEQLRSAAVRGGAAALPTMGLGAAMGVPAMMAPAGTIMRAPAAATALTAAPAAQVAGGAAGGAAGENARQEGYGPLGQAGAALVGGLAGAAGTAALGAGARALRPGPAVPAGIPRTAGEAKAVASDLYKKADEVGGTLTPTFWNKTIDAVRKVAPEQTQEGLTFAGETPVTTALQRLEKLRDSPISLQGMQEIDERIGALVDGQFGLHGLSKDGRALQQMQWAIRDEIAHASPSEVTGGTAGFDALAQARQAWSQAQKMADIERIQTRASFSENPSQTIKTGIKNILSNPSLKRGYSEEEIAALERAGKRGSLGWLLNTFGSKLIPVGTFVGGTVASGNPVTGVIAGLAAAGESAASRGGASYLQNRRLQGVMDALGQGVPTGAPALPGPAAPNSLLPGAANAAAAAEMAQRRRNSLLP